MTWYEQQLQDPRWKEKAERIKARDKHCMTCFVDSSLQAHHKFYIPGRKPWEYRDEDLITLCGTCHHNHHFPVDMTTPPAMKMYVPESAHDSYQRAGVNEWVCTCGCGHTLTDQEFRDRMTNDRFFVLTRKESQ